MGSAPTLTALPPLGPLTLVLAPPDLRDTRVSAPTGPREPAQDSCPRGVCWCPYSPGPVAGSILVLSPPGQAPPGPESVQTQQVGWLLTGDTRTGWQPRKGGEAPRGCALSGRGPGARGPGGGPWQVGGGHREEGLPAVCYSAVSPAQGGGRRPPGGVTGRGRAPSLGWHWGPGLGLWDGERAWPCRECVLNGDWEPGAGGS